MLTAEQISKRLEHANLLAVARACGISYETVRSLARGKADNVRHSSVLKVAQYLEEKADV